MPQRRSRLEKTRTRALPTATILVAAVSFAPSASHADTIYRSVGKDGVISFTSRPVPGATTYATSTKNKAAPAAPRDKSPDRFSRYDDDIVQAAALYQIPVELIRAVIKVESDYDPRAVSHANARGLMQLIPATAERMLVTDIFNPRQNIFGGVRYLRVLANLFNGDLELTVAAYNAGEDAVMRYGGIPPYSETRHYVTAVLKHYRQYRAEGSISTASR